MSGDKLQQLSPVQQVQEFVGQKSQSTQSSSYNEQQLSPKQFVEQFEKKQINNQSYIQNQQKVRKFTIVEEESYIKENDFDEICDNNVKFVTVLLNNTQCIVCNIQLQNISESCRICGHKICKQCSTKRVNQKISCDICFMRVKDPNSQKTALISQKLDIKYNIKLGMYITQTINQIQELDTDINGQQSLINEKEKLQNSTQEIMQKVIKSHDEDLKPQIEQSIEQSQQQLQIKRKNLEDAKNNRIDEKELNELLYSIKYKQKQLVMQQQHLNKLKYQQKTLEEGKNMVNWYKSISQKKDKKKYKTLLIENQQACMCRGTNCQIF